MPLFFRRRKRMSDLFLCLLVFLMLYYVFGDELFPR